MKRRFVYRALLCCGVSIVACLFGAYCAADEPGADEPVAWRDRAVEYARIMSRLQWTPVAEGIPAHPRRTDRYFEPGTVYTGVPYSNGGHEGRYIGFDIYLKTFLAALENPHSVLYTKDVRGQKTNSAGYYGMVCSAFTSYALQSAVPFPSRGHVAPHREGIRRVEPQSAQGAAAGDVIQRPGHVELVTGVTRNAEGIVTHVLVEDSSPPTTRTINRDAAGFEKHLASSKAGLYRITDLDAWRGAGRAEDYLFPNYEEDSVTPKINRVLLLDRGDWVPYRQGETVAFNVMDRDGQGVKSLVVKRADEVVETVELDGPGIVERAFSVCGDYTAHCVMTDGSSSQACEFSVCALESGPASEEVVRNQPWTVEFAAENTRVILVRVERDGVSGDTYVAPYLLWLTDEDRRQNRAVVPAEALPSAKRFTFYVEGENRYGRLRNRHTVSIVD